VIGLDTNVLVCYLTRDDESQWQQASKVIESGQLCFVANIVLCELVWVLRGNPYKFGKDEILNTLGMMLQSPEARVRESFCSLSSIAESEAGKS